MYLTPLNTFTLTTWETVTKVCGFKWSTEQFVGSVKVSGVVTSGANGWSLTMDTAAACQRISNAATWPWSSFQFSEVSTQWRVWPLTLHFLFHFVPVFWCINCVKYFHFYYLYLNAILHYSERRCWGLYHHFRPIYLKGPVCRI